MSCGPASVKFVAIWTACAISPASCPAAEQLALIMPKSTTLTLVIPPQLGLLEGFSSGLISLANYAKAEMPLLIVNLLDLSITPQEKAVQDIHTASEASGDPLFVGITTTTATYQSALYVARLFKKVRPDCIVVLGGHHASPEALTVLRWHAEVDFIIRGEGEVALVALLKRFPQVSDVPNLVYRDGEIIRENPLAPQLSQVDLDRILPEYEGEGLRSAPGKFGHVTYVSARGCPLKCAFCSVANESIRAKSIAAVIRDLTYLVEVKRFTNVAIEDNFFAHSPRRTIELCRAIKDLRSRLEFKWDCQTRVESLRSPEIIRAMSEAGCEAVYLGVEAFHPEHLIYLRKTANPGSYLHMLEKIVVPQVINSGMKCYLNLQAGFPEESKSHRDDALLNLERLGSIARRLTSSITIFPQLHVVYPGTSHWRELLGHVLGVDAFEVFTAWEADSRPILTWLGKRFAHGTGGIPMGLMERRDGPLRAERQDFEIDPVAVMALENYIDDIASMPGIEVFRYGGHLAVEASESRNHL